MLYKLEIENFFSIRDPQVLDLSVDGKVPDPEGRFAPIFPGADVRAPKVIALYGANASGKTTFYVERFLNTHARISLDQLRTRAREKRFFDLCLETRMPVVVDNTNPTKAERGRYVDAAKAAGYDVHCYFFQSRVAECIERNESRPEAGRVPRVGLLGTSPRLEIPSRDEGFNVMKFISIAAGGGFDVEDWRDEVR